MSQIAQAVRLPATITQLSEHGEAYKDQMGVSRCLGNLGDIRLEQGRLDDALAHYLECVEVVERLGSTYETARAMRRLSEVFARQGDPDRAAEYVRRGRELDSRAWIIAW